MISTIQHNGQDLYFVADDMGMPVSYGYPTREQAEQVADLIATSEGQASIPVGVSIEGVVAAQRGQYPSDVAIEVSLRRPDLAGGDAIAVVLTTDPSLTADQVIEILDESAAEYAAETAL